MRLIESKEEDGARWFKIVSVGRNSFVRKRVQDLPEIVVKHFVSAGRNSFMWKRVHDLPEIAIKHFDLEAKDRHVHWRD